MGRERDDQIAMDYRFWGSGKDQATVWRPGESHDGALDLARVAHINRTQLQSQRRRHRLYDRVLTDPGAHSGVPKDRCSRHAGRDLLEQLKPFSAEGVLECAKSSDVAARMCQGLDEPGANWVGDRRKHDRYRTGRLLKRCNRGACCGENYIGHEPDQFCGVSTTAVGINRAPAGVDPCVSAERPTQFLESLMERCNAGL